MTLAKPHLSSAYVSRHVSRDEIYQAFSPLFVLQVTKPGHGGLGTRLTQYTRAPWATRPPWAPSTPWAPWASWACFIRSVSYITVAAERRHDDIWQPCQDHMAGLLPPILHTFLSNRWPYATKRGVAIFSRVDVLLGDYDTHTIRIDLQFRASRNKLCAQVYTC